MSKTGEQRGKKRTNWIKKINGLINRRETGKQIKKRRKIQMKLKITNKEIEKERKRYIGQEN